MVTLNKALREAHGINMCGAVITPAVLLRMFQATNLRWEMHPAQLFSIQLQTVFTEEPVAVTREFKQEENTVELLKKVEHTLFGVTIHLRPDYPESWVRLYAGNKCIAYADTLGVPAAYAKHSGGLARACRCRIRKSTENLER